MSEQNSKIYVAKVVNDKLTNDIESACRRVERRAEVLIGRIDAAEAFEKNELRSGLTEILDEAIHARVCAASIL